MHGFFFNIIVSLKEKYILHWKTFGYQDPDDMPVCGFYESGVGVSVPCGLPYIRFALSHLLSVVPQFGQLLQDLANRTLSQVSAKPSPADEQQQISADSAGRLRRDPAIRKNKINLITIEAHRRVRRFLI